MGRRILSIDTATAACSVALFEEERVLANQYREIGRGHAEKLVPMIASLPDKGKADEILANSGPGSFTGIRIGLSVARALALAWKVPVTSYQCLQLVAMQALEAASQAEPVYVAMLGGHGEFFVQNFGIQGQPLDNLQSLPPAEAISNCDSQLVAGSAAEALAQLSDNLTSLPMLPDAANALLLPQNARHQDTGPVYGRPPDAQSMLGS